MLVSIENSYVVQWFDTYEANKALPSGAFVCRAFTSKVVHISDIKVGARKIMDIGILLGLFHYGKEVQVISKLAMLEDKYKEQVNKSERIFVEGVKKVVQ